MREQKGLCLILAAVMAISTGITSWAADTRVDGAKLTFSYDKAPASGDDIGDITVRAGSSELHVKSAEYTNSEGQDTWIVGDVPEVEVELPARNGYRFSYISRSHFQLSRCNAESKRAKMRDSGNHIEAYAGLKRIGGKLGGTSNLDWEGATAVWDEMEGAKSYDVKLLRDDKTVTTVNTTGTSYNFVGYFNREGDYTFRVRAISKCSSKTGKWSGDSHSFYVDEDELGAYGGSGRWVQDQKGWWYPYDTNGYPPSPRRQVDGVQYYFNNSGYQVTDWQRLDGAWYYLNGDDVMTTGWQAVNGQWYYMNDSGEMQTSWQAINGGWYYLNSSGAMWTNWLKMNSQWYCLDTSGAMTTGWQAINGKWYYLGSSGVMYAGT